MKRLTIELDERAFQLFKEIVDVYAAKDSPAVDIATTQDESECGWVGAPYTMDEFASLKASLDHGIASAEDA